MNAAAIEFHEVTRAFGCTLALDRLDLRVERGQVLGLVGRNGAGKTTALRLAHGFLHPDHGSIRVLGLDPVRQALAVRERVSLLSEESSLYPWMTVQEILSFAASLHERWDRDLADSFCKRLELERGQKIRTLSRGTRAKVALVLAVACRPDVLLLDDPTSGLDPLVRREVLEGILDALPAEGGAVVYASHLVHDVERVADRIAVLDGGRLSLEGPLERIKASVRRATAVFEGDAPADIPLEGRIELRRDGRTLTVVAEGANGDLEASLRRLGAREVSVETLSLEEILVACLRAGRRSEVDRG